jgi:hypothetical protein
MSTSPLETSEIAGFETQPRYHFTGTDQQDNLFARGFPPPDPDTGMYDLRAIDAWMDRRNTITRGDGLTGASTPRNAEEVFGDRARRLLNG